MILTQRRRGAEAQRGMGVQPPRGTWQQMAQISQMGNEGKTGGNRSKRRGIFRTGRREGGRREDEKTGGVVCLIMSVVAGLGMPARRPALRGDGNRELWG